MANLARFTINATPSSSPGFDATISQVLTVALEGGPANLAQRWTLQVFSASDGESPLASKNAPSLTLVGATSGQKVDAATPGSSITTTMPGSGVHSWLVRSLINGGIDASGKKNADYVFERVVSIKTGSGLRKVIATEQTAYSPRGWADAQNDLIDVGAGPITAPGGAADANKLAAANGAGTNLQYAAGIRLLNGGTTLNFDAASATPGISQDFSGSATDTTRRTLSIAAQAVTGNTSTIGGTLFLQAGDAPGAGGTHIGGNAVLRGGWAIGASGTRQGGHVNVGGGAGATTYGNIFLGTDFSTGTNFQGMQRGILVQNRIAAPAADMTDGHAYFSDGGRPIWRFLGSTLRLDGTAAGANAGAGAAAPATVEGYLTVQVNGTTRKIPYYAN